MWASSETRRRWPPSRGGESYIEDVPSARLAPLVSSGLLKATGDYSALDETGAVLVCLPTPLDANREPDLSFLVSGVRDAAPHLRPGALVVPEITTYPGTTREVLLPILEGEDSGNGRRRAGRDLFLAFSPERVDPGNRRYTIRNTPKVVGGLTPGSTSPATPTSAPATPTPSSPRTPCSRRCA